MNDSRNTRLKKFNFPIDGKAVIIEAKNHDEALKKLSEKSGKPDDAMVQTKAEVKADKKVSKEK